jgi:hypothetical protein
MVTPDCSLGFCFYHEQDVESALESKGIWIAFGGFDQEEVTTAKVGGVAKEALEAHGFKVMWNGNSETRLSIPDFDWKRRRDS